MAEKKKKDRGITTPMGYLFSALSDNKVDVTTPMGYVAREIVQKSKKPPSRNGKPANPSNNRPSK